MIGVKEGSWDFKSYVNNYKFLKKINKDFLVWHQEMNICILALNMASDGSQVSLAAIAPEKIVELIKLIENKQYMKQKN